MKSYGDVDLLTHFPSAHLISGAQPEGTAEKKWELSDCSECNCINMCTELWVGKRRETENSEKVTHPHCYHHKCQFVRHFQSWSKGFYSLVKTKWYFWIEPIEFLTFHWLKLITKQFCRGNLSCLKHVFPNPVRVKRYANFVCVSSAAVHSHSTIKHVTLPSELNCRQTKWATLHFVA